MPINPADLRKTRRFESRASAAVLLADLADIRDEIERLKRARRRMRWISLALFLTLLASPIAIALFIYSFFYASKLIESGERTALVDRVLKMLQPDASPRAQFDLKLGLAAAPAELRKVPWPQRKNGKEAFLEEQWLSLKGSLLDGAEFEQTVTDLIRKRTYTNPGGKAKTKTRTHHLLSLHLGYPPDIYGDAQAALAAHPTPIKLPPSGHIKSIKPSAKSLQVKALVTDRSDLNEANIMLFLGAYRILHVARRVSPKGAQ